MTPQLNRRTFLVASVAAAAAGALVAPPAADAAPASDSSGDEFDRLRASWYAATTGGDVDPTDPDYAAALAAIDSAVDAALSTQDSTGGFTDLPLGSNSAHVTSAYRRLHAMATGYVTPGTAKHGDAALLAGITAGLAAVHDGAYNDAQAMYGNWWDWQIGAPKLLNDVAVLLYDQLTADRLAQTVAAVDHFVPDPTKMAPGGNETTSTGANRVDECQVVLIRGILDRNADKITQARDALSAVFGYVDSGDGFYRDGSFVQHTHVAYTGTYGLVLLGGMAKLLSLLAGSTWEVTDPNRQILFDAVERTYAPVVFDDQMMDSVRGRAVSRYSESEHTDGHTAVLDILTLAPSVDASTAARWQARCAGWLDRDHFDNPLATMSVPQIALIKALRADGTVAPAPEPVRHDLFAQMDRAVHRRDGWCYTIAMASERICYYEHGNGENLHGWHQGEGMGYLYDHADDAQFTDAFWPTVDPYRLPGTTVDTAPLADGAGPAWGGATPSTSYAGGAVLDGTYAVVGQDVAGFQSTMTARKSWFCLDEYVVALGAGISGGTAAVQTIVENRNLHTDGTNTLLLDGSAQPSRQGWSTVADGVRWAHLAGVAGYVFLDGPVSLSAKREERTGRWRDINAGGPTDPITRRYLTLWLDHGTGPSDSRYAYLLLPGASAARTSRVAAQPGILVLANDTGAQAIRVPRLGITAANLYRPGTVRGQGALPTTVDGPAAVLLRQAADALTVVVADPTHRSDRLTVRVVAAGYTAWRADDSVTVTSTGRALTFRVDTSAHDGASHAVTFHR
ncbi:lyase [Actinocatenispora thailandica]|uniref:Lyase n=1 Tax=Actinocatenispora thailandica TaxID=227318 RepID=A0A7R7I0Z3_9ACTN|nr:polysaccharide lyase 8 family protein [Actinocatenispora thailandica]BCJ39126.1 lyase [Actinocatenispora thailandica]